MRSTSDRERTVATAQSAFYVLTGVWPLLDRRSFERVTGPKVDFWLVQTVGVLVASVGIGLARAALSRRAIPPEVRSIALTSAGGLALLDTMFVLRGRISSVYLLDALAEGALVVGWLRSRPTG